MLVTLSGTVSDVKELFSKEFAPMSATLFRKSHRSYSLVFKGIRRYMSDSIRNFNIQIADITLAVFFFVTCDLSLIVAIFKAKKCFFSDEPDLEQPQSPKAKIKARAITPPQIFLFLFSNMSFFS